MNKFASDSTKSAIIIGAGITGLMIAYELSKKGFQITVLEKQEFVGGLATSIPYQGYKIDIGPHFLTLPKNSKLTKEIFDLMGQENIIQFSHDTFHSSYKTSFNGRLYSGYPTVYEVIFKSGPKFFFKSLWDFFIVKLRNPFGSQNFDNAKNYLIASYGKFLYEIWFEPYLSKKYPDSEPSINYVIGKFPPLTFSKIISSLSKGFKIGNIQKKSSVKNDDFLICYFKDGMGALAERLKGEIVLNGGIMRLGVNICSIEHDGLQKKVIFEKDKVESIVSGDIIVYAIPLTAAVPWFEDIPKEINTEVKIKKTIHSIMIFLFIDAPKLYDSWVVIFYDKELSLARVSQQNFLSKDVVPEGKTLLTVEIRATDNDPLWNADESEILKKVTHDLKKTKILTNEKLDGHKILKFRNLYTAYSKKPDKTIGSIQKFINTFKNEYALGAEADTGVLVAGEPEQELSKKVPFGGGVFMALAKSKSLADVISNKK